MLARTLRGAVCARGRLAAAQRSVYREAGRRPSRGIAQPGSAAVLGPRGRRFKSCCPDQNSARHVRRALERAKPMTARIYKPAKTAMQSGTAKTKDWVLDFEPAAAARDRAADGLDHLRRHDASRSGCASTPARRPIAYCERHGIAYQVFEPKRSRARRSMSYSDGWRSTPQESAPPCRQRHPRPTRRDFFCFDRSAKSRPISRSKFSG